VGIAGCNSSEEEVPPQTYPIHPPGSTLQTAAKVELELYYLARNAGVREFLQLNRKVGTRTSAAAKRIGVFTLAMKLLIAC
jgi:hypothetical protein